MNRTKGRFTVDMLQGLVLGIEQNRKTTLFFTYSYPSS
jgi:hypothetical protein